MNEKYVLKEIMTQREWNTPTLSDWNASICAPFHALTHTHTAFRDTQEEDTEINMLSPFNSHFRPTDIHMHRKYTNLIRAHSEKHTHTQNT